MSVQTKTSTLQRAILKDSNITVVADGLNTSSISAMQFPELGNAKSFFQVPQVGIVDFGKYSFIVQVDQRRAVASDSSGNLTANGPVPLMMKRFLQGSDGLKISGLGFNFTFEVLLDAPVAEVLREMYLREDTIQRFGRSFVSLGFKLTSERSDHLLQVIVDPIWQNPTTAQVTINFHYESPGPDIGARLVEMYSAFAGEAPRLVELIFSR